MFTTFNGWILEELGGFFNENLLQLYIHASWEMQFPYVRLKKTSFSTSQEKDTVK